MSRELRSNVATRSGGFEYRTTTARWRADRSARRPKQARLAVNAKLRDHVQDRPTGRIMAAGRIEIRGPKIAWKGRRTGRRKGRRRAKAGSPQQIASRLKLDVPEFDVPEFDFPEDGGLKTRTCASATRPSTSRTEFKTVLR